MTALVRQTLVGLRALLVLSFALGVVYPLAVTAVAQGLFPFQANGSIVTQDGRQASLLLAQEFSGDEWLHPRPSMAVGDAGAYDPMRSGGSNLGPNSPELATTIEQRRATIARINGVAPDRVPADAVTASSSGLDPDISLAYAALQAERIAKARGITLDQVRAAIEAGTHARMLGFLGQARVNVVQVNIELAKLGR